MKKISNRDLEFVTDSSEAVLRGLPIAAHLILWFSFLFLVIAVVWANFAVLDEVTKGEGKVIPSSEMQVVQNLEGGIIKEIKVKVGQIVSKDQIIMVIDDTRFSSSFQESEVKSASLQAKIARLMAETNETDLVFPSNLENAYPDVVAQEKVLFESRVSSLNVKLSILTDELNQRKQELKELQSRNRQLQRNFELANKELKLTKPLVKSGAVSEVDVLRLERDVNDISGELEANRLSIPRIEATITSAQNKIHELKLNSKTESLGELNEARAEFKRLSSEQTALEDRVLRTAVRSPVRGTVNQIMINTVGGIVQPGADIVEIVPLEDSLLIEAKIKPSDIGFLRPGLNATVKLTAYDFSIYGGLKGSVEYISPDTITNEKGESFYNIRVRTEENFLGKADKPLPIIPGMRATVDILTGHKTVLDYILKPILKTKEKALRER